MEVKILYEDKDIIVAVKPPGMPSQPDRTGDGSIAERLGLMGEGAPLIVHRLDRPVGGIMVFPKTPGAARKLSSELNEFKKTYYAVCHGEFPPGETALTNWLKKDPAKSVSRVVQKGVYGAKKAELAAECLSVAKRAGKPLSLLKITLKTGRHHQIRVQLSHAGFPIMGDRKYGAGDGLPYPALWSGGLSFRHPETGEAMDFAVPPDGYPYNLFTEIKKI